jgi:hypothetical protein
VADLRITEPALAAAQATFRTAGEELLRVLQFPGQRIGAHDFGIQARQRGADLGIVGQALAELADHASQISAAFTQADQQLSQAAGAVR